MSPSADTLFAIHNTCADHWPAFCGEYAAPDVDGALDAYAQDQGHETWADWPKRPEGEIVVVWDGGKALR